MLRTTLILFLIIQLFVTTSAFCGNPARTGELQKFFHKSQSALKNYLKTVKESRDKGVIKRARDRYLEIIKKIRGEKGEPSEAKAIAEESEKIDSSETATGGQGSEFSSMPDAVVDRQLPSTSGCANFDELKQRVIDLQQKLLLVASPEEKAEILTLLSDLAFRLNSDSDKCLNYLNEALSLAPDNQSKQVIIKLIDRQNLFLLQNKLRSVVRRSRIQANSSYQKFKSIQPWRVLSKVTTFYRWSKSVSEYNKTYKKVKGILHQVQSAHRNSLAAIDRSTESFSTSGHTLRFLINGVKSYPRRYELIESAKSYIYLQTLYFQNDESGNKTVDLLIQKAEEGLDVRVLVDHYNNALVFKTDIIHRLGASKVRVYWINRLTDKVSNVNHRFHQKLMIVDGTSFIVGGMNIGDEYADGGIKQTGWRDSDIEVMGSSLSEAREVFLNNWMEAQKEDDWARNKKMKAPEGHGESGSLNMGSTNHPDLISGPTPDLFRHAPVLHDVNVRLISHYPATGRDPIEAYYIELVRGAKEEIFLETPYFFPGKKLLTALLTACREGKKVTILTNSIYSNDMGAPIVLAARVDLQKLVLAGAHVYEWMGKQTLHSKIGCSDAYFSTVGSYNLNSRSNKLDTEMNMGSDDPRMFKVVKQIIQLDMKRCHYVTKAEAISWDARVQDRLKLRALKMLDYFY